MDGDAVADDLDAIALGQADIGEDVGADAAV
jgi:hypothetical protein